MTCFGRSISRDVKRDILFHTSRVIGYRGWHRFHTKLVAISCCISASFLFLYSCQTVRLSDAREHFARGEYDAAVEVYRKLYRAIPPGQPAKRGVVGYEMAENYRHLNQSRQAATAYRNAIRHGYPDTLMFYQFARMLHREGEYEQSIKAYRDYLKLRPGDAHALSGIAGAGQAMEWSKNKNPSFYRVEQVELFNSNRSDFSPMLNRRGDRLYFTSSREDARGERSLVTGMKYNDIFFAPINVHGEWQYPRQLESPVNTDFDEGTPAFSPDGEWMYYTHAYADPNRPTGTVIHASRRVNGEWSGGREVEILPGDVHWSFAHPAPSPCGNYLFFVSDMPGGEGGKDIWRATLNSSTEVHSIVNMGPEINTPGDEMFPYAKSDSLLYFSSDGHPGMGGLDLFVAVKPIGAEQWQVQNMRSPLNSSADDFGITFYPQSEKGFFSSNRDDARGYDHIYSFEQVDDTIRVEGIVVDHQDELIPGASVSVVGSDGSQRQFVTDGDGEYRFKAEAGVEYMFLASVEGFLNRRERLQAMPPDKDTLVYVDFEMIPFDKPVVMENIFYDFDSAVLRPESKEGLEELASLMMEHPEIYVELSAHTDRMGPDDYNRELSLRRARSVADYLVARGIDKDRLSAIGHGKSQPESVSKKTAGRYDFLKEGDILSEEFIEQLPSGQQEVADQINRRTSFKVIGNNSGTHRR